MAAATMAPTRRSCFALAAAAAVTPAVADAAPPSFAAWEARIAAMTRRLQHLTETDADDDAWSIYLRDETRLWRDVAALPMTSENYRIRALAVLAIYDGTPDDMTGDTRADLLLGQIVKGLAA